MAESSSTFVEDKPLTPPASTPRPRILVVSDDGVKSSGLKLLALALEDIGDVVVVSTIDDQIHPSFSITIQETIRAKKLELWGKNILVYAVSGFPMNCLKFAFGHVLPKILKWDNLDIVIAGINKGRNIGTDLLYSGTMSLACAARFGNESFMKNGKTPKAISLSLCPPMMKSSASLSSSQLLDWNFDIAVNAAKQVTKLALKSEQTPNVVWNVNIPQSPKKAPNNDNDNDNIYYWAVTKPATLKYDPSNLITITKDDEKMSYNDFIVNGPDNNNNNNDINGTDLNALKNNVISISPIELSPALHTPLHATNNLINLMLNDKKLFYCDTSYFWNININIRPLLSIIQCLGYWLSTINNHNDIQINHTLLQTYTLYLQRDIKICPSKNKFSKILTNKFNWSIQSEKFNKTLTQTQLTDLYKILNDIQNQQSSFNSNKNNYHLSDKLTKGALLAGSIAVLLYSIGYFKRSFSNSNQK